MKKCSHKDKPILEMSICKKCTEKKHTPTDTNKKDNLKNM